MLLISLCYNIAFSQSNFHKFAAGAGIGVNAAYADLAKKRPAQTFTANLDYRTTPFSSFGLELQYGTLTGGDRETDPYKRYFKNDYAAISLGAKVQLGQIADYHNSGFLYAIRGLYTGLGVGLIRNSMSDGEIVRVQPGTGHVFPGTNKSINMVVPANAGINFNVPDRWGYTRLIFNFNYQFNVTFGEGLDGYNDASRGGAFSKIPDMYGVASVGMRVCFGREGVY